MNIVKYGLAIGGVITFLLVFRGPNMDSTVAEQETFREGTSLGMAVNYTRYLILASVIIVLAFFVMHLITNTKKTVLSIVGIIAAGIVYLILWASGTTDTNESLRLLEDVQVEPATIVSTTAGIYTAVIGVIVGVVVWILSPFMGRLRK